MLFNCDYLNRTPNKTARGPSDPRPSHAIWHETESPNPDNPLGTLRYNLLPTVQSSYNILIARSGLAYLYVEPFEWVAWQAGGSVLGKWNGYGVNVNTVGVEVDGKGDGTPPPAEQWATMIAVAQWMRVQWAIPLDRARHHAHKEIAPGRKRDPEGYSVDELIRRAITAAL